MNRRMGDNKTRILVSVSGNILLNFAVTSFEENSSTKGKHGNYVAQRGHERNFLFNYAGCSSDLQDNITNRKFGLINVKLCKTLHCIN